MPSPPSPRRHHLTIGQKLKLIEVAELRDYIVAGLARWAAHAFDLPQPLSRSTVRIILSKAAQLKQAPLPLHARKQLADPTLLAYEERVVREFDGMDNDADVKAVRDAHLLALARMIADDISLPSSLRSGFSNGWLYRFKRRHGIKSRRLHGEAASVTDAAARGPSRDARPGGPVRAPRCLQYGRDQLLLPPGGEDDAVETPVGRGQEGGQDAADDVRRHERRRERQAPAAVHRQVEGARGAARPRHPGRAQLRVHEHAEGVDELPCLSHLARVPKRAHEAREPPHPTPG